MRFFIIIILIVIVVLINNINGQIIDYLENPVTYKVGELAVNNATYDSGPGGLTVSVIGRSLPNGLKLLNDHSIVGIPTTESAQTSYIIKSVLGGNSFYTQIFITIKNIAPAIITYPVTTLKIPINVLLNPLTLVPTINGNFTELKISPPLPTGLVFNKNTGYISGTPTIETVKVAYGITIIGISGSSTFTLILQIEDTSRPSLDSLQADVDKLDRDTATALASASSAVSGVLLASLIGVGLTFWLYKRTNRDAKINPDDVAHLVREAQGQSISAMTQNVALGDGSAKALDVLEARSKRPENYARTFSRANAHQEDGLRSNNIASSFTRGTMATENDEESFSDESNESNHRGGTNRNDVQMTIMESKLEKLLKSLDIPLKDAQPLIHEDIQINQLTTLTAGDLKTMIRNSSSRKKLLKYINSRR